MFFSVKKWIDRFSEYPNRRQLTKADGTIEQVTVTRDEGTVSKEGDKFNASTMNDLENRISSFDSKVSNQFGTTDDASTASAAYTAGSYIIHNGVRYKVTVAIAKGDAFNEGTNISKETVNNQIAELNTKITSLNADLAKQSDSVESNESAISTLNSELAKQSDIVNSNASAIANNVPVDSAWAMAAINGTTVTLLHSHNVKSIVTGNGHTFEVSFSQPFQSAYYAAVGSFEIPGIGQEIVGVYNLKTGGFYIDVQNASGNASTPTQMSVIALR